jgi:hypothetical protein
VALTCQSPLSNPVSLSVSVSRVCSLLSTACRSPGPLSAAGCRLYLKHGARLPTSATCLSDLALSHSKQTYMATLPPSPCALSCPSCLDTTLDHQHCRRQQALAGPSQTDLTTAAA